MPHCRVVLCGGTCKPLEDNHEPERTRDQRLGRRTAELAGGPAGVGGTGGGLHAFRRCGAGRHRPGPGRAASKRFGQRPNPDGTVRGTRALRAHPAQAVAALREAREHRRLSGAQDHIAQDFGNVELFAAQLAPGTRASIKRGVVLRRAGTSLLIGGFGVGLPAELLEGPVTAWLIIRGAMWLCLAAWILWSWLPKRIDADTAGARRGRVADARALSAQQSED